MNSISTSKYADINGMTTQAAQRATQALVVRVRAKRHVSQGERKRLIKLKGRDMQSAGLAMSSSRGWCVFTATNDTKLSVSRHQVLNWLIDHEQFDKYMLVDPIDTQEIHGGDVDLLDEHDPLWRQPATQALPLVRHLTHWAVWRRHQLTGAQLKRPLVLAAQGEQSQGEHNGEGA